MSTKYPAELPELPSIGMHRTPKGWVVYKLVTQGDRVIQREMLTSEPMPRVHAENVLRVENVKAFMSTRG